MVREVDLLGYLPPFMQEYIEMQKIMTAEQPDVQSLEDETEIVKDNQFIMTCNEDGINRFEKMLNITSYPEDTLESRKSRVLTRWNDSLPYTLRSLAEKLKTLCGEDGYLLTPNFNDYELDIWVRLSMSGQTDELDYLLNYMIPCNLVVNVSNELVHSVTGNVFTSGATIKKEVFTIESKTNTEHTLTGYVNDSGALVSYLQRTIN